MSLRKPRPDEWVLEGYPSGDERLVRIPLHALPFRIGRAPESDLRLSQADVSSQHAELFQREQRLWLRDLGSRNGTFLNRERLAGEAPVQDGDVLHIATVEFRLLSRSDPASLEPTITRAHDLAELPRRFFPHPEAFQTLLREERFEVHYQPIVRLSEGRPVAAWEALGRPTMPGLPDRPDQLFQMAEDQGAAAALSRAMRRAAVRQAGALLDQSPRLFVNTHPAEMEDPLLLPSLEEARALRPEVQLVLEIHEGAVTKLERMRALARDLARIGVQLSYDDFGAGQARLLELVEAPPAVLKFDRSMVAGLPVAGHGRRELLRALVAMVRGFGIETLAEGVETEEEARLCAELGFALGQGWAFGRPRAAGGKGTAGSGPGAQPS